MVLRCSNQSPLESNGEFSCELKKGDKFVQKALYVVKNITNALLGRPAIEYLGSVVRVERVIEEIEDITKSYPKLFGIASVSLSNSCERGCKIIRFIYAKKDYI